MTREEAIQWLEETLQDTDTYWDSCSDALQKELDEQKEVFLLALSALRPVSREQELEAENKELKERIVNWRKCMTPTREQVEKVWPGCNICKNVLFERIGITEYEIYVGNPEFVDISDRFLYCPKCGKPLTDEAVQMVMERLEALYGEEN